MIGDGDVLTLPPESRLAKLRRLQAEISDLENEISQEGDSARARPLPTRSPLLPPRSKIDLVSELASLRSRLSQASEAIDGGPLPVPQKQEDELVKRLRRLEVEPTGPSAKPTVEESQPMPPLGDVDKRLSSLEDLVGIATAADQGVSLGQDVLY